LLVVALLAVAAPGAGGGIDASRERMLALAAEAGQREGIILIGLDHAHRITIGSGKAFRVLDPATGKPVWKPEFSGTLQVVAEGGPKQGVPSIFRVQVGAFQDRDAAEKEARRLSEQTGAPGVVHHDPDRGNWRVRLGRADDRMALGGLLDELRLSGIQGLWIAEEPAIAASGITLRLVDDSYDSFPTGLTRLAVVAAGSARVEVEGKPYRGLIELRVGSFGTVRPINWVAMEQYLLGVVPAELGPAQWPELAALKAQAVAARTYARRNLGQFSDQGFDLCDSPRCQVYHGASAEHPLSDRAVWSTAREVLTWKNEPIVALYTATCGGHTEDGKEIFPEHDEPYLRGVPCRAEADGVASPGSMLRGRPFRAVADETGTDVTRAWALLAVAGVLDRDPEDPETVRRPIDGEDLRRMTRSLAALSGIPEPSDDPPPVETLGQAVEALVADLGWADRSRVLLSAQDSGALLRDPGTAKLDPGERRALAYLAWVEAIGPHPDGGFEADEATTRARLAPALVKVGESYRAFGLKSGVVAGVGQERIHIVQGRGSVRLPVATDAILFGRSGGKVVALERLPLWPGDLVRFRTNDAGALDFLELQLPVKGTSDDRTSKVYSWEVRRTRRQLETAVNRRVSVGRLEDLQVVRRGISGRIVELRVVGSRGTSLVRGFDVRRLLDLRESLLVIEIQRDGKGKIEAVVFAGKGWGHGVGMCQVGAYGMALRGSSYREILAHYYQGTKLERMDVRKP
jgi:stage II sporulation protein D